MSEGNLVYHANGNKRRSYAECYFRDACYDLAKEQAEHEERYLKAILGLNKDAKYFEEPRKTRVRGGDRKKDLLYPYWTEEDLRLALGNHLSKVSEGQCIIHGQVHLHSTDRHKITKFPDIYFIAKKERERNIDNRERNVEAGAVEIKKFEWWQGKQARESIKKDLRKLISYCNNNVKPHSDHGFFICIDESGKAKEALEDLFSSKNIRNKRLAYAVITPKFVRECRAFPRDFEDISNYHWERRVKYVVDRVLGKLRQEFPEYQKNRVGTSGWGWYITLRCGEGSNWAALIRKEHSIDRPHKYDLVICMDYKLHGEGNESVTEGAERFKRVDRELKTRLCKRFRESWFYDLNSMNELSDKIFRIIKKAHSDWNRMKK